MKNRFGLRTISVQKSDIGYLVKFEQVITISYCFTYLMGNADGGPSKKRAAGRELTRDNSGLDNEDSPEEETGTFKRADEEVLATRRFVKVRRHQTTSDPSPNPFAGICLVTPNVSNANAAETTVGVQSASEKTTDGKGGEDAGQDAEKAKDESKHQPELKTGGSADKSVVEKDNPTSVHINAENFTTSSEETEDKLVKGEKEIADNVPTVGQETAEVSGDEGTADCVNDGEAVKSRTDDVDGAGNEVKKEKEVQNKEQNSDASILNSFQQLSSTQNAFTGLAGTGFSSSNFSFGSVPNEGSALNGASSSILKLTNRPGLGLSANGNSSVFSSSVAGTVFKGEGNGFPALPEVPVETGEENEKSVFNAESVLFEFVDKGWKERGKGELKVNVSANGTEAARLLMRARGNYRLILNARLYADMKLTDMDKRGVTFVCINSAIEGRDGVSTFAVKFKDAVIVDEFRAAVMEHKGKATTVLKTPENSSNASEG